MIENEKSRSGRAKDTNMPRDLSNGVIVVLSGGPVDEMNPPEVRLRMETLISEINKDPAVLAGTGNQGLKFKLLPDQVWNHIHNSRWLEVCQVLEEIKPSPLIMVGHSNGGAAVIRIADYLAKKGIVVDFAFTADSVPTLDDVNDDVYEVPSNVKLNLNSHLNPNALQTAIWWLPPFAYGLANKRKADGSLDGILNISLLFFRDNGMIAHRDMFYDLAGGDQVLVGGEPGGYIYPELIRDATLAVLKGATNEEVFQLALPYLQTLADRVPVEIETDTLSAGFRTHLNSGGIETPRPSESTVEEMRQVGQMLKSIERLKFSMLGSASLVAVDLKQDRGVSGHRGG